MSTSMRLRRSTTIKEKRIKLLISTRPFQELPISLRRLPGLMPTKISRLEMAIMWSLQTKRFRVMSLLTWAQKLLELTRHIFQLLLLTIQDPLQDLYLLSAKLKRQTCLVVMTLFDMDRRSRLRWINICTARLCTFPVSHWARPYIPQWVASRKHLLLQKRTHWTTPGL